MTELPQFFLSCQCLCSMCSSASAETAAHCCTTRTFAFAYLWEYRNKSYIAES